MALRVVNMTAFDAVSDSGSESSGELEDMYASYGHAVHSVCIQFVTLLVAQF